MALNGSPVEAARNETGKNRGIRREKGQDRGRKRTKSTRIKVKVSRESLQNRAAMVKEREAGNLVDTSALSTIMVS